MIKKVIEYEAPPELLRGKLNMGHGKFINLKVTMSTVEVLDQLKVTPYSGITIISGNVILYNVYYYSVHY